MNDTLIANHNSVVASDDIVYHLGDFSMSVSSGVVLNLLYALNGLHFFILGSHDRWLDRLVKGSNYSEGTYSSIVHYRGRRVETTIKNNLISMDHYCQRVWAKSHYNSWHIFGHCLDIETEILTDSGWKFRNQLLSHDKVLSLNIESGLLEYNDIIEIVDYLYTGDMYSLKSKGIDLRVTSNHVMIDISRGRKNNVIQKFYAQDLNKLERRSFIKAGLLEHDIIDLSDDAIRMLVWIAADGSLANSNLGRIRVIKERKKERIKWLLSKLNIIYTDNLQKDGSICYNFQIPKVLNKYELKPISNSIINFNRHQVEVLIDEYTETDGYKIGNSKLIYTSKKEEADRIQTACITNGFTCNYNQRIGHGFSKKANYELVITDNTTRIHSKLRDKVIVEPVIEEPTWCVKVQNQTIFIRRNGKPLLVGNSHGELEPIGKSWDVGVDNNDYYPVSFNQLQKIMESRPDNPNLIKKQI